MAKNTAIFVTFDEGGGYYDSGYVQQLDFFGDGTRIPMIVVSKFSRAATSTHTYTDHVSTLKFIEANWGLKPITSRSRDNLPNPITATDPYVPTNRPAIGDLMDMFNFGAPHPEGLQTSAKSREISTMTTSTLVKDLRAHYDGRALRHGGRSGQRHAHAHPTSTQTTPRKRSHSRRPRRSRLVIAEGYQVNDLETLTNNMVTLSGGGPNLLGSTWQSRFAALGSNSYTFSDGSLVPALGFAAQDPPDLGHVLPSFATVPGDTYTYSFGYSNNTAGFGATFEACRDGHQRSGAVDLGDVASRLHGLGLAGHRARRTAASIG